MVKLKKGQRVYVIENWDSRGSVFYVAYTVRSSGAKQTYFQDGPRGNLNRSVSTDRIIANPNEYDYHRGTFLVVPTDADVYSIALKYAEQVLADERARLNKCLMDPSGDARYIRAIQRNIDSLHEPRALSWDEANAETLAAIGARKVAR